MPAMPATSLRHIIAQAGVNLAAVHYYFGSKEELKQFLEGEQQPMPSVIVAETIVQRLDETLL